MEKEKFSQIDVPFRKEISDRFLNLLLPNLGIGPREFYHGDMVAPIQLKEEVKEKKISWRKKEMREKEVSWPTMASVKIKRAANVWCHETGAPEIMLSKAPKAAVFFKRN